MRKYLMAAGLAVVCFALLSLTASHDALQPASAQTKKKAGGVKTLDVRAQKLQADFERDSVELAREYETAGELDKARQVYSALNQLNPQATEFRDRLQKLDEAILLEKAFEVELDTSLGWGVPLARVTRGKKFQIQSGGSYKFQAALTVGPEGFPVADPTKNDMAGDIRAGSLMGLIVSNGKPGKPFAVGQNEEITPRNDGLLYLRVNVPAGSKCSGKLTVRLGGEVERN